MEFEKHKSPQMFDRIATTYDGLNRILSCGIDIYWRNKMLRELPRTKTPLQCLDLATGTGDVALTLIKDPRVGNVRGLDLSRGMLAVGQKKVQHLGLDQKVQLLYGDGVSIPEEDQSFDVVSISFGIRNFPDVSTSLRNCLRVLKPGGRLLILEFSLPKNTLIRSFYLFYFRKVLPFLGRWLSKDQEAYTYLNQTVEHFPYGEKFATLMREQGFQRVHFSPLTFGIATLYVGEKGA
jgi:demethylmenaquinone methyltransferase / 2-methoxy-6-polyprenyl-1,4-benzoquinol methylase